MLSLNIRGATGAAGWRSSAGHLDAVAAAVAAADPDLALLQEVDDFAARSLFRDQVEELAARLRPAGAAWAAPARYSSGRGQGVMVIVFGGLRLEGARNLVLSGHGGFPPPASASRLAPHLAPRRLLARSPPRNAVEVLALTPGERSIRVLSAHLSGTSGQERELAGLAAAATAAATPVVLGGDFNVVSAGPGGALERELLGAAGLTDAFIQAGLEAGSRARTSFPSRGWDLDRIYVSDHWSVRSAAVLTRPEPVSDHLAVLAEVELG